MTSALVMSTVIDAARRAGLLLFAVVAIGVIVWNLVPQSAGNPAPLPTAPVLPTHGEAFTEPPAASPVITGRHGETREYALALDELQGFPPDAHAGMAVEVWVTWDRPSARSPNLHKLIPAASVARIIPPTTPQGPTAVVLSVPIKRIPDLLFADGYGSLSITTLP